MGIINKVAVALQGLLGDAVEQAAQTSGVIVRRRVFTAASLAQTFVLGFLRHPDASTEQLAQMATQCGAPVTPQAVDQRQTPALVQFLQTLFVRASRIVVGSDRAVAPLLDRFARVVVLDSTTISLPDSCKDRWPGCGAKNGGGQAAMKLQTEFDLRSGAVTHIEVESGRSADAATSRQQARHGAGSLRITDLGYFNVAVFAEMTRNGEYFLSRLQFGTQVLRSEGVAVDLLGWLATQPRRFMDRPILLGRQQRLACRLIAWRPPKEQAQRRRQKLRQEMVSRKGKLPSAERLAWCDWTILVTNVSPEMIDADEAVILYRARWQVELLFKRWKAQDRVAVSRGTTDVRQMVAVWSRLVAALMRHWLIVGSVWGDPTKSLSKVGQAIRDLVDRIASSLRCLPALEQALAGFIHAVAKTCRRDKRSHAGTFELLNDSSLLDFRLT